MLYFLLVLRAHTCTPKQAALFYTISATDSPPYGFCRCQLAGNPLWNAAGGELIFFLQPWRCCMLPPTDRPPNPILLEQFHSLQPRDKKSIVASPGLNSNSKTIGGSPIARIQLAGTASASPAARHAQCTLYACLAEYQVPPTGNS
jgi:hypothetical protein